MSVLISKIEVFARKAGYKPEELLSFRALPDGGAVGIVPTGQKYTFTAQEMHDLELVMIDRARAVETLKRTSTRQNVSKVETKPAPPASKPVTKKGKGGSATRPPKK